MKAGRATCSAQDVHETTSHTYLGVHQRAPRHALLTSTLVCFDQGMAPLAVQAAFAAEPMCPAAGAGRGFASRLHSTARSQGSAAVESPDNAQGEPAEPSPSAAELSSSSNSCAHLQLTFGLGLHEELHPWNAPYTPHPVLTSLLGSAWISLQSPRTPAAAEQLASTFRAPIPRWLSIWVCMERLQFPSGPQLQRCPPQAALMSRSPCPLSFRSALGKTCSPQVADSRSGAVSKQHLMRPFLNCFSCRVHME